MISDFVIRLGKYRHCLSISHKKITIQIDFEWRQSTLGHVWYLPSKIAPKNSPYLWQNVVWFPLPCKSVRNCLAVTHSLAQESHHPFQQVLQHVAVIWTHSTMHANVNRFYPMTAPTRAPSSVQSILVSVWLVSMHRYRRLLHLLSPVAPESAIKNVIIFH